MNIKSFLKRLCPLIFLAALISLSASPALARSTKSVSILSTPITTALTNYSSVLATGTTPNNSLSSSQMNALIADRRNFYQNFVNVALNLNYVDLKSQFLTTSDSYVIDSVQGNIHQLAITEIVSISTSSKVTSPDEYPLVQSANWAISHASSDLTKQALQEYLQVMTNSVNELLKGATIEFDLRHRMVIVVDNNQATIVQDSYDDKSNDNINGYDVVTWTDNGFERTKQDFTQAIAYQISHTPIDVLGKSLLDTYNTVTLQSLTSPYPPYQHGSATNYINAWVKTTSKTCAPNVPQDPLNYSPAFNYYSCADCTNFVSQALHAGALQYDSTWQPYTTAWVNVWSLNVYLQNQGRVTIAPLSSLMPGDIAYTSDWGHVVMYSDVTPQDLMAIPATVKKRLSVHTLR